MKRFDNKDTEESVQGDIYGREEEGWKTLKRAGDTYRDGKKGPTNYGGGRRKVPKKILEIYGEGKDIKRTPANYGRKKGKGFSYDDNIPLGELNEKLGDFDGIVKLIGGEYVFVPISGDSVEVSGEEDFSGKKFVELKGAYKIADNLFKGFESGECGLPRGVFRDETKSPGQIYKFLTGKEATRSVRGKGLEATMVLVGLFIFSFVGILLTMQKSGFTGFTVANLANSSINVGVVFCILGIIGLLIYRFKFSDWN